MDNYQNRQRRNAIHTLPFENYPTVKSDYNVYDSLGATLPTPNGVVGRDFRDGVKDKNPCARRFRNKKDIVRYITDATKTTPSQKTISRAKMFLILYNLSMSTNEYYDDKEINIKAFNSILYNLFNKDELCLEVDKNFYDL